MRNLSAPRISQGREVHLKLRGKQLGNWHDDVVRDSATFGCRDGTQRRSVAQSCQTTHHRAIALGGPYSGSSVGLNSSASGAGGSFAFYATPTTLSVVEAGSLSLKSDTADGGGNLFTGELRWDYQSTTAGLYIATDGNATWLETDKATLDSSLTSYAITGGVNNWVIATAVPEPSVTLMSLLGALFLMRRRR